LSRPFSSRSFSPPVPLARVNGKIRAREVRVIDGDQKNLGVISLSEAITMARSKGVDLVEVNPNAVPPVCRLVDFGKFRYEQAKREKESRKHQHANKVKEIQLSPNIDPHDFAVKQQHAVDFLCEDMKVKVTLRFRGREMAHKEFGFQQVEKLIQSLTPFGHPDAPAKLIGKGINVMLSPLPRAKRSRNPRESGSEVNHAAPLPATATAPAAATNHSNNSHPREQRPVESDQRATETASVGGQEFGNNAFANLEYKQRS
jgi:translation initiation factor IF-3